MDCIKELKVTLNVKQNLVLKFNNAPGTNTTGRKRENCIEGKNAARKSNTVQIWNWWIEATNRNWEGRIEFRNDESLQQSIVE